MLNRDSKTVHLILVRLFLNNKVYRFNRNRKGTTQFKPYCEYSDADWRHFVEEKRDIWLNYVLPSIRSQTTDDFECLAFVDPTFPQYNHIKNDIESAEGCKIIYTDMAWGDGQSHPGWKMFVPRMQKEVRKYVDAEYPNCKWLTTQRLDSDDLICKDFMADMIADVERDKTERWIIFNNGFVYKRDNEGPVESKIFRYRTNAGMHHTYSEPYTKNIRTAWCRMHNLVKRDAAHKTIIGVDDPYDSYKPYWLDFIGYKENAKRDDTYRSTKFRSRRAITKDQLESIERDFCLKLRDL